MEENTTNNTPQEGTWATMTTQSTEDRPGKVEFKLDDTIEVHFDEHFSGPREYNNKNGDGVFYVFDVETDKGPQVVMTSAWSLLRGLKLQGELAGKNVKITKVLLNGRQSYTVANATPFLVEAIKA